jgi:hypothetical protein
VRRVRGEVGQSEARRDFSGTRVRRRYSVPTSYFRIRPLAQPDPIRVERFTTMPYEVGIFT